MSNHPASKNKYPAHRKPRRFTSQAEWRQANRVHLAEYNKAWITASGRKRAYHLRYNYGLTTAEWDAFFQQQQGRCAVCRRDPKELKSGRMKRQRLHVDHDHATNTVRGLLCEDCNFGIGKFADDPDWLRRAAAYLEK